MRANSSAFLRYAVIFGSMATWGLGFAFADSRDDILREIAKCTDVTGGPERLACFDAQTPQLRAMISPKTIGTPPIAASPAAAMTQPAPQSMTPPPAGAMISPPSPAHGEPAEPTRAQQESWFGLHLFGGRRKPQTTPDQFGNETVATTAKPSEPAAPEEIDKIVASVSQYALTPYGKVIVFLGNGQIWQQAESDTGVAHFRPKGAENTVEISRALLGSYSMQVNGRRPIIKVTRIK
jgi:hypothetical protein